MSSKSQKAEKAKAAKVADAVAKAGEAIEALDKVSTKFIPMPKRFNQSIQQIVQQAQMRVQDRVATAMELNSDIPKDWMYNAKRGGFAPPAKEGAPDGEKREGPD